MRFAFNVVYFEQWQIHTNTLISPMRFWRSTVHECCFSTFNDAKCVLESMAYPIGTLVSQRPHMNAPHRHKCIVKKTQTLWHLRVSNINYANTKIENHKKTTFTNTILFSPSWPEHRQLSLVSFNKTPCFSLPVELFRRLAKSPGRHSIAHWLNHPVEKDACNYACQIKLDPLPTGQGEHKSCAFVHDFRK